jgi:hypothetical protein
MRNSHTLTSRGAALFTALVSVVLFAAPLERAFAASTTVTRTSSVDDPGRIAYQSKQLLGCKNNYCSVDNIAVPSGHRLVTQHASGFAEFLETSPKAVLVTIGIEAKGAGFLSNFVSPAAPDFCPTSPLPLITRSWHISMAANSSLSKLRVHPIRRFSLEL